MTQKHAVRIWVRLLTCWFVGLGLMLGGNGASALVLASPQNEGERRLWDEGLLRKRPAGKKTGARRKPKYQLATAPLPANLGIGKNQGKGAQRQERLIGITLWKMRPPKPTDTARLMVRMDDSPATSEKTPERSGIDAVFAEGEHVRLTIESPTAGYLYVIDREKYADGSVSEPYLIFPTTRLRSGDNQVTAGRLIEIPAQTDNPPYLTVHQNRSDHIGELITVIVSDKPLKVQIGRNYQKLPAEQVAEWEKQWEAPVARIDQVDESSSNWTEAEQEAGQNANRLLKQDEPLPQCIFCVAAKPGDPLLLKFDLKYTNRK